MTIDERLEALKQTMELLGRMHVETEAALQKFVETTDRFEEFAKLVLSNQGGLPS